MSETIIEKLLKGAEVEWKTLEDIFTLKNGYTPSKSVNEYWIGGTVPWFRMEDLRAGERILKDSAQKVHIKGVKGKLFPKDSIIMSTSATVGEHALILTDFLCNQRFTNFSVREKYKTLLDIKYVYYYFFVIDKKAQENTSISSFPSVQMDKLKKWMFPIPTLSVQQEIVRILDAFTAHTAELTAELNERKKQYNYYRDKLLTFSDDEVEWKPLGEVGELIRGNGLQKKDLIESGVPAIHYGQIYTYYGLYTETTKSYVSSLLAKKLKKINCGDLVITNTSENIEDVLKPLVYIGNIPAVIGGHASIFKPRNYINGKYIAYLFNTNFFFKQKEKIARGTKVIEISLSDLSRIVLPIPSLERQKRIVSILDKFDALTTSISEGLPKEVELRNKQYEYYRDQLLNFPKPDLEN